LCASRDDPKGSSAAGSARFSSSVAIRLARRAVMVPRFGTVPAAWWHHPFVLASRSSLPANITAILAQSLPTLEGDYYAEGATSIARATRADVAESLERLTHAGSAAYLLANVPPSAWSRLLAIANVHEPGFAASVPEVACNLSSRLEREVRCYVNRATAEMAGKLGRTSESPCFAHSPLAHRG
jgi:hypothetical protein